MAGPLEKQGYNEVTSTFEPMPDLDCADGYVIHLPVEGPGKVYRVDLAAGWGAVVATVPAIRGRKQKGLIEQATVTEFYSCHQHAGKRDRCTDVLGQRRPTPQPDDRGQVTRSPTACSPGEDTPVAAPAASPTDPFDGFRTADIPPDLRRIEWLQARVDKIKGQQACPSVNTWRSRRSSSPRDPHLQKRWATRRRPDQSRRQHVRNGGKRVRNPFGASDPTHP